VCFQGPYLHLTETLTAELSFTTQRLLCYERVRTCGTGMDLIVNQMVQFQVMHETDGDRRVELFTGTSVTETNLSGTVNRHALPLFSVVTVVIQILHDIVV